MRKFLFALVILIPSHAFAQANLSDADSLISQALYPEAVALLKQIIATQGTPEARNRLAEVYILQGKLEEAEAELRSLPPGQTQKADALKETNLGFLYLNKARFDLALNHLQQALALYEASGGSRSLEAANCLSHLSLLYWSTGKFSQAESTGLLALQIRQAASPATSEVIAGSYNDLGLVYGANDVDKGLEYYELAQSMYEKIHGPDHPKMAIVSINIGFMYKQLKLYGDAIANFERAEKIWKKIYPDGHPNEALSQVDLGLTYREMGNTETALAYFDKALAIYRKAYKDRHPDIANVLNQKGSLRLEQNQFDLALIDFQDALRANSPTFDNHSISANPTGGSYYNATVFLHSLRLKAEGLEARHFGKTLNPEDLKLALRTLHVCDTLIDDIRNHSNDENDKLQLGGIASEVYEDGVRIAFSISEMVFKPRPWLEDAFYFAEKSKSAVLLAAIADAEAKSFSGIPANLLDEESGLKSDLATLNQKLSQKPDPAEESRLRTQRFETERKYQAFVQSLEKTYPEYFNLKFSSVTPSVAAIQQKLAKDAAMICYFMADKGQKLYTFVITPRKFRVFPAQLPIQFDRQVKGFNNSLFYSVPETFERACNTLSPLLLRGWPSAAKSVVVIPSGRLSTMPFEALSLRKVKPGDSFGQTTYVVNKWAVSYEFSASLFLQAKDAAHSPAPVFLCAPVKFPEADLLAELPGTAEEVDAIASLYPNQSMVAKGAEANEQLIKSGKLSDYRILHLATHGIVDEQSPELSRIFLQTVEGEDGHLYAGEIFNLQLNADLTVLSACQTGLGKFSKGEGVIGLSRALLYAGARNLIVSYWSVADESTSQLMTDFYRNVQHRGFAESLQLAKQKMLKNPKFSAPYFWAPFVLIGK